MPRNVLKGRSDRDLASEFVLRTGDPQAPVKVYSTADLHNELMRRHPYDRVLDLIEQATKTAQILGG